MDLAQSEDGEKLFAAARQFFGNSNITVSSLSINNPSERLDYFLQSRSHRNDGGSLLFQCCGPISALNSFNSQVNLLPALLLGGLLLLGLPLLLSLFPGNVFPYLYFVLFEVDSEKSHDYGSYKALLIRWLPPY